MHLLALARGEHEAVQSQVPEPDLVGLAEHRQVKRPRALRARGPLPEHSADVLLCRRWVPAVDARQPRARLLAVADARGAPQVLDTVAARAQRLQAHEQLHSAALVVEPHLVALHGVLTPAPAAHLAAPAAVLGNLARQTPPGPLLHQRAHVAQPARAGHELDPELRQPARRPPGRAAHQIPTPAALTRGPSGAPRRCAAGVADPPLRGRRAGTRRRSTGSFDWPSSPLGRGETRVWERNARENRTPPALAAHLPLPPEPAALPVSAPAPCAPPLAPTAGPGPPAPPPSLTAPPPPSRTAPPRPLTLLLPLPLRGPPGPSPPIRAPPGAPRLRSRIAQLDQDPGRATFWSVQGCTSSRRGPGMAASPQRTRPSGDARFGVPRPACLGCRPLDWWAWRADDRQDR